MAHWTGRDPSSKRGLDLGGYFNGTLNIDIHPNTFQFVNPEFTFYNIEWTDLHPPEHFSFSRCEVVYKDIHYKGWDLLSTPGNKAPQLSEPLPARSDRPSHSRDLIWGRSAGTRKFP